MENSGICFREYPILAALAPFVKCIWSLESDRPVLNAPRERILPDSCVELVFHFGDPFRRFHIESFVCEYAIESISDDGRTFVFVSGPMENFMAGWRGRETYRFLSNDEFIETFALAPPGKDFATYSETRFRRK